VKRFANRHASEGFIMVPNGLLKVLTFLLILATVGMLAMEASKSSFSWEDAQAMLRGQTQEEDESLQEDDADTSKVDLAQRRLGSVTAPVAELSESRLAVGTLGAVPAASQVLSIAEVPWLESEVNAAFDRSADFACRLLLPDVQVKPYMNRPPAGTRGLLGRMPAVTVGLEVDSEARSKLPQASRGAIEAYLRDHRLAIQPILYQNEQGQPYFGTDCRAAFYPVSMPSVTVKAEPMIEEAIGRFRALGILRESSEGDGRTLVMAFRYVHSDKSRMVQSDKASQVTELLFLHLASQSTDKTPTLEVFATSDSRQKLHRLMTQDLDMRHGLPDISATVRFDSFVLMGLYPAKPVVTGVRQRATAVLGIDTVLKVTKYAEPENRLTFQQVLDQFSSLTGSI
jgi:hypothetical protein